MRQPFASILFDRPVHGPEPGPEPDDPGPPAFFGDLNLDQVVDAVTKGREQYNLSPFFHAPLSSAAEVSYRQAALRDLDGTAIGGHVATFAEQMRAMRASLAQARKLHHACQQEALYLEAVDIYCEAVSRLAHHLADADPLSAGFRALRDYLGSYAESGEFTSLRARTTKLKDDLAGIRYCLHIKGNRIRVTRYDSEPDYSR